VNETWHPVIDDVVYNGMDWLCPAYTGALGEQLQKYYGKIDEFSTIEHILPTVQTGDLHIAFSDLSTMQWYISYARRSDADPNEPQVQFMPLCIPICYIWIKIIKIMSLVLYLCLLDNLVRI
jgi:hypothetical protein